MNDHKTEEKVATSPEKCTCSSLEGLFVPNRQLSVVVSCCIAMLFFSFVAGYFLGGQHATQDFVTHIEHIALNDQMSSSLCALAKECSVACVTEEVITKDTYDGDTPVSQEVVSSPENAADPLVLVANDVEQAEHKAVEKKYYAQLIGFGSQQAAQRFVKKLEKKDIPVSINKHSSRTAQGKTIHWYQVVTLPYEDEQQLRTIVDIIQRTEKIRDARIITC